MKFARTPIVALVLLALTSSAVFSAGCDSKSAPEVEKKPWSYASEKAPYSVLLGAGWIREDPTVLNEFADLAVSYSGDIYFIVIPQELPTIEGVDPPDALDLKRAGVSLMETQITDLEIQKQGPVRVDERAGQSVVARGVVDEQPVKYVTTYLTEGKWGFQLVGWAPLPKQRELLARIDELLATWEFTEPDEPAARLQVQHALPLRHRHLPPRRAAPRTAPGSARPPGATGPAQSGRDPRWRRARWHPTGCRTPPPARCRTCRGT